MTTKTEAIKNFLLAKAPLDLAELYSHDMECQCNVSQGKGERIDGEYRGRPWYGWTDGQQTWKNFRIPLHANSEPMFNDSVIKFDLATHAEGIGMTGWNWVSKQSKWVAFDFDVILGHSDNHDKKLTDEQLSEVQTTACAIPWVTVRRSTSGNGLHLYVELAEVDTQNHNEHAALARAILAKMSALTGFDFDSKVDACGGNIWVWHTKYERVGGRTGPGLKLIKQGAPLLDIPINWRDHIKVTSGSRKKNKPSFVSDQGELAFEELCGQNPKIPLDTEHRALLTYLDANAVGGHWWDQDHHMLVVHTADLKRAHAALSMRGVFETVAVGKEQGDQNGFCFPVRKGGWSVRRHTPGVQESDTWEQDSGGWTRCYLNSDPDIKVAARAKGGNEKENGGFYFREAEIAAEAAKTLGAFAELPTELLKVPATLKSHKDGRLILEIDAPVVPGERASTYDWDLYNKLINALAKKGWVNEKKKWKLIFGAKRAQSNNEEELGNFDDLIRHLVNEIKENRGWVMRSDGNWGDEPLEHIRAVLLAQGVDPKNVSKVVGSCVTKKWTLVNRPFQPEYPGDRCWNRKAAQLRYAPSTDLDNLNYPTWSNLLNHVGAGLDSEINRDEYWKQNSILRGGDYLKAWIASMFQFPLKPLPYLFFYGEQRTGKSTFHEAVSLLMTSGYKNAGDALESQGNFNGELEHAVFCYIEEKDLRANKSLAYSRIKDWVTSLTLNVHVKGMTPYMLPNTTHWCQFGNSAEYCPIFPGDTRITMLHVEPLADDVHIPKDEFLERLKKEAPDFIAAIMNYEIPRSGDRLNLRVIETEDKRQSQEGNKTEAQLFLDEHTFHIPGKAIKYSELWERFEEWLPSSSQHLWTQRKFGRELPLQFPKGKLMKDGGQWYVANISWTKEQSTGKKFVLVGQALELEEVK